MNYLFIIDPIEQLKIKKDTSLFLMRTLLKKKLNLFFDTPAGISLKETDNLSADVFKIKKITDKVMYDECEKKSLNFFKKIFIRVDPPFDANYLNLSYLLEQHKHSEIINSPSAIRNFNEKLSILNFRKLIAPTLVSNSTSDIKNFIKKYKKVILKPIHDMAGNGIFLLKPNDPNINVILESMTKNGLKQIIVQKFIKEIKQGDKRIIVLNGNPLPYALLRVPQKNEVRANLAKGGKGILKKLTKRDLEIIKTIKSFLIENNLNFVGIDVIGDYLTEINVTSPTGLVEIASQANMNIEEIIINELS
jgi:glutathione synthase